MRSQKLWAYSHYREQWSGNVRLKFSAYTLWDVGKSLRGSILGIGRCTLDHRGTDLRRGQRRQNPYENGF